MSYHFISGDSVRSFRRPNDQLTRKGAFPFTSKSCIRPSRCIKCNYLYHRTVTCTPKKCGPATDSIVTRPIILISYVVSKCHLTYVSTRHAYNGNFRPRGITPQSMVPVSIICNICQCRATNSTACISMTTIRSATGRSLRPIATASPRFTTIRSTHRPEAPTVTIRSVRMWSNRVRWFIRTVERL